MNGQERTVGIQEIPHRPDWLSAGEAIAIRGRTDRRERCAARLLAKQMLFAYCGPVEHYSRIHIESQDGRNRATRPQVYVNGSLIPWNVSLSHSDKLVSVAILPTQDGQVGVDLVNLAAFSMDSLKYWLTSAEATRALDHLSTGLIWSLKEAIYKATNQGASFFPRQIDTTSYLSEAEWLRVTRELRIHKISNALTPAGQKLSLSLIDETIKTLVWCPATRHATRVSA